MSKHHNGNKLKSFIFSLYLILVSLLDSYLRKSDYLPSMDIKLATLEDQDCELDSSLPQS